MKYKKIVLFYLNVLIVIIQSVTSHIFLSKNLISDDVMKPTKFIAFFLVLPSVFPN